MAGEKFKNGLKNRFSKRLLVTLLLSGICLLFAYLETLIPSFGGEVAYAKLRISPAVVIFTLMVYGVGESILVMGISALSVGLIINNSPFMILYFLVGGLLLVLTVFALQKTKMFGLLGLAVGGLVACVLGETIMSAVLLGTPRAFAHFPMNAIFGAVSGILSGAICYVSLRFLPMKLFYSEEDK